MNHIPTPHTCLARCGRAVTRGFGLIELMISLVIASFLLLGLMTTVANMQSTNVTQTYLAGIYDKERFASALFGNAIQHAGYFVVASYPVDPSTISALSPSNIFANSSLTMTVPGQVVGGTTVAPAGSTPEMDTLNVRFQSEAPNAGTYNADASTGNFNSQALDCLAGSSAVSGTNDVHESDFSVQVVNNVSSLVCQVSTSVGGTATYGALAPTTPVVLLDGVAGMQILYGVDASPASSGSVTQYIAASSMINANWTHVRSVQITLWFTQPPGAPSSQRPVYTQTFPLMYQTKATW